MADTVDLGAQRTEDEIRLRIPAAGDFLRLARVTAAGLASRLGFTFDDVEDLRLAIDEACFSLIGKGGEGSVELRYIVLDDGLEIRGRVEGAGAAAPVVSEWSGQILKALVDDYDVTADPPEFRLVKRRTSD